MLSYAHGGSTTPLLGATLGNMLANAAASQRHAEAIVAPQTGQRMTYRELHDVVHEVARGLLALGVAAGDRVGVASPSCVEWIVVQFASAAIGAVLVPLAPTARPPEMAYALEHVGVSVLFTGRRTGPRDVVATLAELIPALASSAPGAWCSERVPQLRTVVSLGPSDLPGVVAWEELARRGRLVSDDAVAACGAGIDLDDAALILYTSGTTGRPKAVTLSHHSVVNGGHAVGQRLRLASDDRMCLPLPLHHVLGCVAGVVAAVTHGAAIVLPAERFDAQRCLEAVAGERCTAIYGVPTMFIAQLERLDATRYRLDSLRTGVVSGAGCSPALMQRIVEELHAPEITVGYGMTEMAPILYTAPDDPLDIRATTAGRVQPHVECKIVDAGGRIVPRGVAGELHARGYCVMRGYWNDADATAAVLDRNGWMRSGDLAVMREDGCVSIVGRLKDLIIRGGDNIAPREIEALLQTHPRVRDAHVVGVPDHEYGEEVCACVQLTDGPPLSADELRRYCRSHLTAHKIPRYVFFVTDFPKTSSGKVMKSQLRELAAATVARDGAPEPVV